MIKRCTPRYLIALMIGVGYMVLSPTARADSVEATSHVIAATILPDRAILSREVKSHIPSGAHVLYVKNVPAGIDESSLRVEGKGNAAVKIGAVEVKHVYLGELANEAERAKNAEIETKQDERALVEADITALETRSAFISRLVSNGPEKTENGVGAKIDFQPEKWMQAWGFVQTGMAETQKELAAKRVTLRKIDMTIQKLNQELAQIRSTRAMERRDVHIHLEATNETDVTLTLTYQTGGIFWQPVYDARLDTASAELTLEQYGNVSQQTGEDWSDVALTLSTARPAMGSEMPQLYEWQIGAFPQPLAYQGLIQNRMNAMAKMEAVQAMDAANAPASAPPPPLEVQAIQQQASVVSTEYASEFKVPGRVDLKSTADATKFYIHSVKMRSVLSARVTPRLDPHAYLFVEATNNAEFPIIPGAVAKYRDGTFIGNAPLPLLRPNEKADLSFGPDDRIKVIYKRIKDDVTNPALMVGDMTVLRQYQTKIQNLHKAELPITVYEQYPVSANPDIKIEMADDLTTKDYIKDVDGRPGVIQWRLALKAGEEKIQTLGFKVKYPKNTPVNGL